MFSSLTTSVNLSDSSVLDELTDIASSHTTSSHDMELISCNGNHLANNVLSLHDSVILEMMFVEYTMYTSRSENTINTQLNASLCVINFNGKSTETASRGSMVMSMARWKVTLGINVKKRMNLKGPAASIRRRFFSISIFPSFVRQPMTTPLHISTVAKKSMILDTNTFASLDILNHNTHLE